MLVQSDVVTLHVPLTEETRKLIGADELRSMKHSALFINTSGGGLVDEADWQKKVHLDHIYIYHMGVGASEPYTQYKQTWCKGFQIIQLGETAVQGAAKLGFDALERKGTP